MDNRTSSEHQVRTAVIVGGSGAVGMLLSQSLRASGVEIVIADAHRPAPDHLRAFTYVQCDLTAESVELREAIATTDALVVCLPETVTIRALPFLTSALRKDSLWVDTLSVKTDVVKELQKKGGPFQAVSINPMFAPRLGWNGQCVAFIELFAGGRSSAFKELLREWGARLEETTAGEHDRLTSLIQVATHAAILSVGAALLAANLKLDRLLKFATPPHKLLLVLIHRLTTQSPEVYWDIQAFHPFGHGVRDELIGGLRGIDADVNSHDPTRFLELLDNLKRLFKDDEDVLLQWTNKALTI